MKIEHSGKISALRQFHTEIEAKWTSKPTNNQNVPASIPHFPAKTTLWSKFFYNTDVVGVFQSNGNESRKIFIFAALTFISLIFRYEILYAKYVDLLDKLREVKK
jgi:hypothetical protein